MARKIRVKDIEGDADALASFFKASDCSLGDYLQTNSSPKINHFILIVTGFLFVVVSCVLWLVPIQCIAVRKILIILCLTLVCLTTLFSHLYWKNTVASLIVAFFSICLFMVAIGEMTPAEFGDEVNQQIEKITTEKVS